MGGKSLSLGAPNCTEQCATLTLFLQPEERGYKHSPSFAHRMGLKATWDDGSESIMSTINGLVQQVTIEQFLKVSVP